MTAREFLNQYRNADAVVRRYKEVYRTVMLSIDTIRSLSDNDGMPHGSGISKPVEDKAIRLIEASESYLIAIETAELIKKQVLDVINQVPDEPGEVLYQRYILLKSWREVALNVGYSLRRTHDFHKKALREVEHCIELHTAPVV